MCSIVQEGKDSQHDVENVEEGLGRRIEDLATLNDADEPKRERCEQNVSIHIHTHIHKHAVKGNDPPSHQISNASCRLAWNARYLDHPTTLLGSFRASSSSSSSSSESSESLSKTPRLRSS